MNHYESELCRSQRWDDTSRVIRAGAISSLIDLLRRTLEPDLPRWLVEAGISSELLQAVGDFFVLLAELVRKEKGEKC